MILKNSVINFHRIENPQWVERTIQFLKRIYNLISTQTLEDYFTQNSQLNNVCHLTFDDGDESFYKIVFPILKKHNIPASIYVSPTAAKYRKNFWFQEIKGYDKNKLRQIINKTEKGRQFEHIPNLDAIFKSMRLDLIWDIIYRYQKETGTRSKSCINMDVNQIIELQQSGLVDVGAHTQNHPILKIEDKRTAEREIEGSINELSDILDKKVKYFAYPNGDPKLDFGVREIRILEKADIKLAFSTENKSFNHNDNPLCIPRKGLTKGGQSFIVLKLITGSYWNTIKKSIKGKQISDYRFD